MTFPRLKTAPGGTVTWNWIDILKRKARCAICGKELKKGDEIQRIETVVYWDGFHGRFQTFIACPTHNPYEIFGG